MQTENYRCWAEINLTNLANNVTIINSKLANNEKIMAVVKADAYGCGATKISEFLQKKFKINHFAVATIEEALELRKANIAGEILVLGYTPTFKADLLAKHNISQTIFCKEYALNLQKQLEKISKTVQIHIALNTGMNRIGFNANENFLEYLNSKYFKFKGIFTHLCCADSLLEEDTEFTNKQIAIFKEKTKNLNGTHCKNSAAILRQIGNGCSLVRPGIILYGLQPSAQVYCNKLKPIMTIKTKIIAITKIKKGETIGYGRTYEAKSEERIATIPIGYGDGFPRLLSNNGEVMINGKNAKIVGNVCMDYTMINITKIDAKINDTVELFNSKTYTADDMAKSLHTIGYELICNIGKRAKRIFLPELN